MLLTFSRHQIMLYSVMKLQINGNLSHNNKVKNKIKHLTSYHFQHCFRFILHFQGSNHNFYFLLLNLSTLLCYIDLEISP